MNGLMVLEFNEVNRQVLERMVARGELPNFAKLMSSHGVVETIANEEYEKLEPWIQWVTAHTGKTQAQHGAFNLSDVEHTKLVQIWDVLEQRGIPCGVVSPMNARRGALKKGFFIPDPWSTSKESYPEVAAGMYQFLAERVQSHNVTLEAGSSKLGFALSCLKLGVSLSAMGRLATGYLQSRLDKRNKWKLASELDRFLFELTLTLKRKFKTEYTSVFMNSVAHYQHHYWTSHESNYWKERFPALFKQRNPVSERNLQPGDDPIAFGMKAFDAIVGRAIDAVGADSVMIVTGLSQIPFEGYDKGAGFYLYRPIDHQRLFSALGVEIDRIAPLMSRDAMLYFKDEGQRAEAFAKLTAFQVNGQNLFLCTEESDNRVFCKVIYSFDADEKAVVEGPGLTPGAVKFHDHLLLITFKTGHHSPAGLLICSKAVLAGDRNAKAIPLQSVPGLVFRAMKLSDSEKLERDLVMSPA